jgi:DNA polymerase delta, subunit 4
MDAYVRTGKPRQHHVSKQRELKGDDARVPLGLSRVEKEPRSNPPISEKEQLEDELRMFDLDARYGPFVGVDRLARWKRAERMGLDPPEHVLHILTQQDVPVDSQREGGHLW